MIKLINEFQELEEEQFEGRTDITEAVISGVESIPFDCFKDCVNLRRVTIKGNCSEIGVGCFEGCSALEEVILQKECEPADASAFGADSESGIAPEVEKRSGVDICAYAFEDCVNLERVDFLEDATSIGTMAFKNCISLLDIHLGKVLEDLAKSAFLGCDVSKIRIDDNPKYSLENDFLIEKGDPDFYQLGKAECRALYYVGTASAPRLPRHTTVLSDLCFNGGSVSELSLSPSLLSLDDFDSPGDKFTITEVFLEDEDGGLGALPDSGTEGSYDPFGNCSALERFRLQKGNPAFSVMKGVLYSKDKRTLVRVPPAWPGAIQGADDPTNRERVEYVIPEGTRAIANYAFSGCATITDVALPSTLETICYAAFANSSVTRIAVAPGNRTYHSDGVLLYETNRFDRPEEPRKTVAFCNRDAGSADVRVSSDTTAISPYAFENCVKLSQIDLPNCISFIGESAFEGCGSLEEMSVPGQVTGIEPYAFGGCSSLRRLRLPDGCRYIGKGFLRNCSQDIDIYISRGLSTVSDYMFSGCDCAITFSLDPGYDASGYDDVFFYDNIVDYRICDESEAGAASKARSKGLKSSQVDDRVGGILRECRSAEDGSVRAYNSDLKCCSLVRVPSSMSAYDIPDECGHIARDAFLYSNKLEYLYIPDSVTYVDYEAVYACHSLRAVRFPEHAFSVHRKGYDEGPLVIRPITAEEALHLVLSCDSFSEIVIGQKTYSVSEVRS